METRALPLRSKHLRKRLFLFHPSLFETLFMRARVSQCLNNVQVKLIEIEKREKKEYS